MTLPVSATIEVMSEIPPVVVDCDRALAAVQHLVDNVRPDQWAAPTPCSEWNVRQLLQHIAGGNAIYASIATGERPAGPVTAEERAVDRLGDDPVAGFRATGKQMHDAFAAPGFLEGEYDAPMMGKQPGSMLVHMRINELLVHGWDLAHATGQQPNLPEDLAEQALAMWRHALAGRPRGNGPFSEERSVPHDAPASDRLAAFLGRQP